MWVERGCSAGFMSPGTVPCRWPLDMRILIVMLVSYIWDKSLQDNLKSDSSVVQLR